MHISIHIHILISYAHEDGAREAELPGRIVAVASHHVVVLVLGDDGEGGEDGDIGVGSGEDPRRDKYGEREAGEAAAPELLVGPVARSKGAEGHRDHCGQADGHDR